MAQLDHIGDIKQISASAYNFRNLWFTATTGLEALVDDIATSAAGDDDGRLAAVVKSQSAFKATLAQFYVNHNLPLRVVLTQWAETFDRADVTANTDSSGILAAIREWQLANITGSAYQFESRGITNNAPSADGGNTGDSIVYMLSEDEDGYEVEATYAETLRIECRRSRYQGTNPGQEEYEILGERAGEHVLLNGGSGARTRMQGAWDRTNAVSNANFGANPESDAAFDALATATKLVGWEITTGTATNLLAKSTSSDLFKPLIANTSRSIGFNETMTIEAPFRYQSDVPLIAAIPVHPNLDTGAAASGGTASLKVGNAAAATQAISGLTSGQWKWIVTTLWPSQIAGGSTNVVLSWTSRTSGKLWWGPLVIVPMVEARSESRRTNKWFAVLPGEGASNTDPVAGDFHTQSTTIPAVASTGKTVDMLYRLLGTEVNLPHTGSPSTTEFQDP